MELCQLRSWPVSPQPAKTGPGQLPWYRGAGTGWHRRAQAGTGCSHRGWSYEAPTQGGVGCWGVQRLQRELAGLWGPGHRGPGGRLGEGRQRDGL